MHILFHIIYYIFNLSINYTYGPKGPRDQCAKGTVLLPDEPFGVLLPLSLIEAQHRHRKIILRHVTPSTSPARWHRSAIA